MNYTEFYLSTFETHNERTLVDFLSRFSLIGLSSSALKLDGKEKLQFWFSELRMIEKLGPEPSWGLGARDDGRILIYFQSKFVILSV